MTGGGEAGSTPSGTGGERASAEAGRLRAVREERREGGRFAVYAHGAWEGRFPGLVAGVTAAGPDADFGIGTASPPSRFLEAHAALAAQLGFGLEAVVRQVHGARIVRVEPPVILPDAAEPPRRGGRSGDRHLYVAGRADGLVTRERGILLVVTAADCVPVYLVEPSSAVLGLFHAGWRGTAAGVLERGVERALEAGARADGVHLHLGPGICGRCYEVGAEVLEALGLDGPAPRTVDLHGVLAARARALGIGTDRVSRSGWCTRCEADRFHSHRGRGKRAGRMAAYLGWRSEPPGRARPSGTVGGRTG